MIKMKKTYNQTLYKKYNMIILTRINYNKNWILNKRKNNISVFKIVINRQYKTSKISDKI